MIEKLKKLTFFDILSFAAAAYLLIIVCYFLMISALSLKLPAPIFMVIVWQIWPLMGLSGIIGFVLYKIFSNSAFLILTFAILGLIAAIPFLILCMLGLFSIANEPMSHMTAVILASTFSTIVMIANAVVGLLKLHKISLEK